jgi:enoyl-[acyl-carrier protein] reductase/trans-2-enoyl-CoA reductase (NAD+)
MIIKPRIRGFICTTAHPAGCEAHVQQQIDYVKAQKPIHGSKKALIIGASTGFGLSSRIAATFGSRADTIGVFFERPAAEDRTGTAGWYNTAAFTNGDAFSNEIKQQTIQLIREQLGKIDLVVYSIASPRRTHPETGETFTSVLKPIGQSFTDKTVNTTNGEVTDISIEPSTDEEIRQTVAVMGGEDWEMWLNALQVADVLAEGVQTVAYSYIGPEVTHAIYRSGTIGQAKEDLEATAHRINKQLSHFGGRAFVSVNKALVTQASSAIPVVPLYISILYKIMKAKGIHEGTIEQMYRLQADRLYSSGNTAIDSEGRIRIDDWEMREDVQAEVNSLWNRITTETLPELTDIEGYREDFLRLFGFGFANIDYDADVDPNVQLD